MDNNYINKEIELPLACARARVDSMRAAQIRQLAEDDIDWEYLVKAASRHGLVPRSSTTSARPVLRLCLGPYYGFDCFKV